MNVVYFTDCLVIIPLVKISSHCLAEKVHELKCINLDEQKCCLLACFADPRMMVICLEPSNSIYPDEVLPELRGANVGRSINPRDTDVEETDPLWDFFCPTKIDKQGKS